MNKKQQATEARGFTVRYSGRSLKLLTEVIVKANNRTEKVKALWDTGASGTCIASELAEQLGLIPIGNQIAQTPSGQSQFNTYCVDLILPNNVGIRDIPVAGTEIRKQGFDVLIGMDIIGMGDFAVSSYNGFTQFTFRIPSLCDADFNNRTDGFKGVPIVKGPKVQPNDPCPCNSGKKYKFCCGKKT